MGPIRGNYKKRQLKKTKGLITCAVCHADFNSYYYLKKHEKNNHQMISSLAVGQPVIRTYIDFPSFLKNGMFVTKIKTTAFEYIKSSQPTNIPFGILHLNDPKEKPFLVKIENFSKEFDLIKMATKSDFNYVQKLTPQQPLQLQVVTKIKEYFDESDNTPKYHILPAEYKMEKWDQDFCRAKAEMIAKKREEYLSNLSQVKNYSQTIPYSQENASQISNFENPKVIALSQPILDDEIFMKKPAMIQLSEGKRRIQERFRRDYELISSFTLNQDSNYHYEEQFQLIDMETECI